MSGANIAAGTIPSSAISGGISVSLPTTTMTTRIATEIGYTQSVYWIAPNSSKIINTGFGDILTTLTLNGPVGSVWLVNAGIRLNNPCGVGGFSWSCHFGDSGLNYQGGTWPHEQNVCGGNFKSSVMQISGFGHGVIASGTNKHILVLGCYAGTNLDIYSVGIKATRIA
jgi:hypothetical protein